MMMNRRTAIRVGTLGLGAGIAALAAGRANASQPTIEVSRSPSCGCCGDWIAHMQAAGFTVEDRMVDDLAPLKAQLGIPADLHSCHTGVIAGYAVEGHVPAEDVLRLIAERPAAIGIAVPGMPLGSPGMEMGSQRDPYDVILFGPAGRAVFANH